MLHEVIIVKFTRNDFLAAQELTIPVDEWISVEENDLLRHSMVTSVPECHVTGTLTYDGRSLVHSDLEIEGTMMVQDSITGEDLDVDFETESSSVYSFEPLKEPDEDITVVKKETIDLNPEIFQAIVYEAPMSITRLPRDQYPKGDSWVLISDQDQQTDTRETDPRWAKLNEIQFDD